MSFTSAMLAGHQLTADELLHWKIELARRAGKTVSAIETITPRPRIGIPITFWPPKPWPEHARDLMALGAASARTVCRGSGIPGAGEGSARTYAGRVPSTLETTSRCFPATLRSNSFSFWNST